MILLQFTLAVLLSAVALGWIARHFDFPYPIALVLGGIVLGFVPALPLVPFEPQIILASCPADSLSGARPPERPHVDGRA
jgi:CPA1 family monovalent cation:H+ antiporter